MFRVQQQVLGLILEAVLVSIPRFPDDVVIVRNDPGDIVAGRGSRAWGMDRHPASRKRPNLQGRDPLKSQ